MVNDRWTCGYEKKSKDSLMGLDPRLTVHQVGTTQQNVLLNDCHNMGNDRWTCGYEKKSNDSLMGIDPRLTVHQVGSNL